MNRIVLTYLFLITSLRLSAQSGHTLSGKVTDKMNQQVIANAVVSIPDLHTTVQTDSSGIYQCTQLPSATYEVQVSCVGYRTQSVLVSVKHATVVNIELERSSTELLEVVVTGTSKATQIKKSPLAILAVNKEYLTTNLSTNIIDAIAKLPGVTAVTTGPNVSKPFIRGLGYNRILTLFDGVRQEGQQWGDEHGIEVDKYLIERVEVIKGPASLIYGSDALAGVVNLIPNQPAHLNTTTGEATAEYQANNGMYGASVFFTQNKNNFEWGGRVSKRVATNFQNAVDGRVYNTGFDEIAANAFAGIHKKWGYTHLNLSVYDNQQEIPDGSRDSLTRQFTKQITEADLFRPVVSNAELNSYRISTIHQRVQHYRAFWKNSFFLGAHRLSLNLAYQSSVRREYSHPEQPYTETPGLYLQLNTFNYDVKYFLPEWKQWAMVVGVNGMVQTNRVTQGTEFVIPSYNQRDFGGFISLKKSFEKLNLAGGLRYDVRHFNNEALYTKPNPISGFDQPVTGADTVGADKPFAGSIQTFEGLSGSIGLSYVFNNNWTLKMNVSKGYRAPNISEISANGVHPGTGLFQRGNHFLKSEFNTQADMGVLYTSKSINAGASFFINQVDQYIYNTKILDAAGAVLLTMNGGQDYPTYQYQQGQVLLYGLEANLDLHLIQSLHLENTVSLVYGDNKSYQGRSRNDSNQYVPLMPPARYLAELRYDLSFKSNFFSNSFIKFQFSHTATQNRVFSYNQTETPTAGYSLINIGAGSSLKNKQGKRFINLSILVNNVFDVAYQDHLSRLKYFEQYKASPNGRLGIYNMGRNMAFKVVVLF